MLIDPHLNPHDLSPSELIDRMVEASVDGAVITCTHSAQDAVPYLKALVAEEFVCFAGVELRAAHGSLVFIPEELDEEFLSRDWAPSEDQQVWVNDEARWSDEALNRLLSELEGVVILAHPYSRMSNPAWGDRAFTLKRVDAVETRIGRGLPQRDHLSDQIAQSRGWSRVGSSGGDCQALGAAVTVVGEHVESQRDLCAALRGGVCWPIEFEDPMYPRARYQGVLPQEGSRYETLQERERRDGLNQVARKRGYQVRDNPRFGKAGRWS